MKTLSEIVRDSIEKCVWGSVWGFVYDPVSKSVWDYVNVSALTTVEDSVRNFVWSPVKQTLKEFVNENN